jgi:pyruvate,water dikinase
MSVGRGQVVSGKGCEGVIHRANEVQDVLALLKSEDLEEAILLTESASATAVVPLLAKVRGIVCRSGGMTSHLAIVAREFGLAAIMGAELDESDALEGQRVVLTEDGEIVRR